MRVICILDTMWGNSTGRAIRFFPINLNNHSGRRLYKLLGYKEGQNLWVTNVCKYQVNHSAIHGKPDPEWLRENLEKFNPDLILVCGSVARKTFGLDSNFCLMEGHAGVLMPKSMWRPCTTKT